ncbi:hypothetical protein ABL78_6859 [Leptomonas seymouri]|uniref:Uncharacterized protein n=1 Tax=Leptomonas seymouri TaxID=5684 RepID=A0A0N1HT67_LEPSE|nr:hypothetical protein ABL78_6859 [Leptomonas seymouri]|eukprot:KPI84081.1 hypothetical protein ABL78_6859 [Leptomonas seymouri]
MQWIAAPTGPAARLIRASMKEGAATAVGSLCKTHISRCYAVDPPVAAHTHSLSWAPARSNPVPTLSPPLRAPVLHSCTDAWYADKLELEPGRAHLLWHTIAARRVAVKASRSGAGSLQYRLDGGLHDSNPSPSLRHELPWRRAAVRYRVLSYGIIALYHALLW